MMVGKGELLYGRRDPQGSCLPRQGLPKTKECSQARTAPATCEFCRKVRHCSADSGQLNKIVRTKTPSWIVQADVAK